MQRFSNAKTPHPPWIHVVKLTVPMVCCDEAATYLIEALGGENIAKRVVGGVKWWQVRGLQGYVLYDSLPSGFDDHVWLQV